MLTDFYYANHIQMSSGTPLMTRKNSLGKIAGRSRDGYIIAFHSWWNKQNKSVLLNHFAESASESKIFDKSKMKWPEALFQRLVWEVHRQERGEWGEGGAGQRIQHWRPPAALTCPAYYQPDWTDVSCTEIWLPGFSYDLERGFSKENY